MLPACHANPTDLQRPKRNRADAETAKSKSTDLRVNPVVQRRSPQACFNAPLSFENVLETQDGPDNSLFSSSSSLLAGRPSEVTMMTPTGSASTPLQPIRAHLSERESLRRQQQHAACSLLGRAWVRNRGCESAVSELRSLSLRGQSQPPFPSRRPSSPEIVSGPEAASCAGAKIRVFGCSAFSSGSGVALSACILVSEG